METQGIFGVAGTYGERDNKILFGKGMRILADVNKIFELLAVQLYVADVRSQFENGHCSFEELDNAREVAKKIMEARYQKKENK